MRRSTQNNLPEKARKRTPRPVLRALMHTSPVLAGLLAGVFLTRSLFFQQTQIGMAAVILPPTQHLELLEPPPEATPSPSSGHLRSSSGNSPGALPDSVLITDIEGHRQSMPLSCEARSAVDWASHFGVEIDEVKFFKGLPSHDNPELGFVGDVHGSWGQIPPNDYGVHAAPIAQRLREYGLNAKGVRHMTLEALQAELAAGRPVILWVVGHVNRGTPVPYTGSDGGETIVAKFEHTVIAIGYTETRITVLDGARTYSIYHGELMKSWDVLENQAVVWID